MVSEQGRQQGAIVLPATWWRTAGLVLVLAAVSLLAYLVFERFLRTAATILLLAGVLTYLLQPIVAWLVGVSRIKHTHVARVCAVLLLYLLLAGALFSVGSAIAQAFSHSAAELRDTWLAAHERIPAQVVAAQEWYRRTVPPEIQQQIATAVQRELRLFPDKYLPGLVSSVLGLAKTAGQWVALLIELIFVPLVAFYFLTDSSRVREQVLFFVPRRHRDTVETYAGGMNRILRHYVHGQLVLCAIAWLVVTVGLLALGIPGAVVLGIIAGIARAIPVIGPVVGGIPVLAAVLFSQAGAPVFWWVLVAFTVLHLAESKVLMPRILGDHLDVHPVLVILSLLVGYEMLGLLGMFLAPPAVAVLKFVLALRRSEGPFARPMSDDASIPPADEEPLPA